MADLYKPKKKKVNKPKPNSVKITEFHPLVLPGQMPGNLNIIVFGLGDDQIVYQWNGETEQWTKETSE